MKLTSVRLQALSPLSGSVLSSEVKSINDILPVQYWSVSTAGASSSLEATYTLKNHRKTWEFLNSVAASSYKLRHHPTITTTYNKVHFSITTHDAGNTLTYNDTKLATAIHNIYADQFAETSPVNNNPATSTMNEGLKIIDELTKRE